MRWSPSTPTGRMRPAVLASGLLFATAGLMFAVAANASQGTDLRAQRATELRELVRLRSAQLEAATGQLTVQQQAVDDLAAGRIGDPAVARARADVAGLAVPAGLADVLGPGLTVTLDDAPPRDPADPLWAAISANDVIVHQADVQAVVNALWRGGARAMQVMDQRIVATSSVQCVGNTLILQGRVYSPPYAITAIGPVRRMRAALRADRAVAAYRSWASVVGLGYVVERRDEVAIPGYVGPVTVAYARTTQ